MTVTGQPSDLWSHGGSDFLCGGSGHHKHDNTFPLCIIHIPIHRDRKSRNRLEYAGAAGVCVRSRVDLTSHSPPRSARHHRPAGAILPVAIRAVPGHVAAVNGKAVPARRARHCPRCPCGGANLAKSSFATPLAMRETYFDFLLDVSVVLAFLIPLSPAIPDSGSSAILDRRLKSKIRQE